MNRTVRPGHTFVANGTLQSGVTLTAAAGIQGGPGGEIEVTTNGISDGSVVLQGGSPGQAGGSFDLAAHGFFLNEGSFLMESGRYASASGSGRGASATLAGLFDNAGTAEIGDNGSGGGAHMNITSTGELENSGLLRIDGGIYNTATGGPDSVAGGTLTVAGVLSNLGTLVAAGGDSSYGADSRGAEIAVSGYLTNAGSLLLGGGSGGSYYTFGPGYGATMTISGQMTNDGRIEIGAAGDSFYRGTTGASGGLLTNVGVVTNAGAILVDGSINYYGGNPPAGTFASAGQLTNLGTITAGGGGVPGFYHYGGPGGVVLIGGQDAVNDGILIAAGGAGSYAFRSAAGGTIAVGGVLANAGSILVQGGQERFGIPAYGIIGFGGYGGEFNDAGTLNNTGLLSIGAGAVDGAGTSQGLGGTATVSGTLVNVGTIFIDAGSGGGTDGLLNITATGTLIASGGTIVGGGVLDNAGLIDATTAGAGGIDVHHLVNDGTIRVDAGATFSIAGSIAADAAASGHLVIAAGADVILRGAVAADQSVAFTGAGDTLSLDDAAQFAGVLQNLTGADTIDLIGLHALSAQASGTTLSIALRGGENLHLALGAALGSGLTIRLGSDGHGGTNLLFGHG